MAMSKQELERYYFEKFRADYPLPKGELLLNREKHDKPDLIWKGERTIGIELTRFYVASGASSEQVQGKARAAVLSQAQRLYSGASGRKADVSIGFDEAVPVRNPAQVAQQLAAVVRRFDGQQIGSVGRHHFKKEVPELGFLYLHGEERENPEWRLVQVYDGQIMSTERLREIIAEKEAKTEEYEPCDTYWLLVIIDFWDRAQDQEIPREIDKFESTVFEKVIVYKTHFGPVEVAGKITPVVG